MASTTCIHHHLLHHVDEDPLVLVATMAAGKERNFVQSERLTIRSRVEATSEGFLAMNPPLRPMSSTIGTMSFENGACMSLTLLRPGTRFMGSPPEAA
jgi:hypothetical protein